MYEHVTELKGERLSNLVRLSAPEGQLLLCNALKLLSQHVDFDLKAIVGCAKVGCRLQVQLKAGKLVGRLDQLLRGVERLFLPLSSDFARNRHCGF